MEDTVEHLQEVIDLAAAIALWIEEAKIENPEALQLRVDVDLWYAHNFLCLSVDRDLGFCELADFFWSGLMSLSFLPTLECPCPEKKDS